MKKFKFFNIAIDEMDIDLYINGMMVSDGNDKAFFDYFGVENTASSEFVQMLKDNQGKNLTIHINSEGGLFEAGVAMYNALMDYKGKTTAIVEGLCASAATLPMIACEKVQIKPMGMLMIHCAAVSWSGGNKQDLYKDINMLETLDNTAAIAYEIKTGLSKDRLLKMMEDETWMDCHKAKKLGFVDEIDSRVVVPESIITNHMDNYRAVYNCLNGRATTHPMNVKELEETKPDTQRKADKQTIANIEFEFIRNKLKA